MNLRPATGRERKKDGEPWGASFTIIFFWKQSFAKLHFPLNRQTGPENINVKGRSRHNPPVMALSRLSRKSVLQSSSSYYALFILSRLVRQ